MNHSRKKDITQMNNINRITLMGNTGKHEPKTGATPAGKMITRLSVATNKSFKDDEGNWQTKAQWHTVAVHGASAEYASRIEPGTLVFVEGELTYREYEKDIDGKTVKWPITEIGSVGERADGGVSEMSMIGRIVLFLTSIFHQPAPVAEPAGSTAATATLVLDQVG
jgi:single-strand DNA-binding protein